MNVGRSWTPITTPWTEIWKSVSRSGKSGFSRIFFSGNTLTKLTTLTKLNTLTERNTLTKLNTLTKWNTLIKRTTLTKLTTLKVQKKYR